MVSRRNGEFKRTILSALAALVAAAVPSLISSAAPWVSATTLSRLSAIAGMPNVRGVGSTRWMSMLFSTPALRQWSAARYAIFCGAPAHLIGPDGIMNTAVPEREIGRAHV